MRWARKSGAYTSAYVLRQGATLLSTNYARDDMHTYKLTTFQEQRVRYLTTLASRILRTLAVNFTAAHLEDTMARAWLGTTSRHLAPDDSRETPIVNWGDPTNMAVVLLEALTTYHLKHEVTDRAVGGTDAVTLLVLPPQNTTQTYADLLGLAGREHAHELEVTLADGTRTRIDATADGAVEAYVVLRRSSYTGEPNYSQNIAGARFRVVAHSVAAALAVAVVAVIAPNAVHDAASLRWAPVLLTALAGLYLCYALVRVGATDARGGGLLDKLCSRAGTPLSCRTVLSSRAATIFGLISVTDLGAIYFASLIGIAVLGLLSASPAAFLGALFWYSIAPLPFSVFSIYYQVFVLRTLCGLCILVQAILWMQGAYFMHIRHDIPVNSLRGVVVVTLLLVIATVSALYYLSRGYAGLSAAKASMTVERDRVRNDRGVFGVLRQRETSFDSRTPVGALVLGNPDASIALTAVLSPACGPCADRLAELRKLIDWFDTNISVSILLMTDDDTMELHKDLLHHTLTGDSERAMTLLENWFAYVKGEKMRGNRERLNIIVARWRAEYGVTHRDEQVNGAYAGQMEWFAQQRIPHTPLLVLNGRYLPQPYWDTAALIGVLAQDLDVAGV